MAGCRWRDNRASPLDFKPKAATKQAISDVSTSRRTYRNCYGKHQIP